MHTSFQFGENMKIGKFIRTIIYAPRIIPFVIPKRKPEEPGIPIELPKREPALVPAQQPERKNENIR